MPAAVNPLSWVGPDENTDLRLGLPGLSTPFPDSEPAKKKVRKTPSKHKWCLDEQGVKVEEPYRSTNGERDL